MREVIDELSLKIDVNAKRGIAKTITAIADAITTLNKSVRNVGALERYVKTLNKLMKPATRVPKNTAVGKTIKAETEEVAEPKSKGGQIATENLKANQKIVEDTKNSYKELSNEMKGVANANKNVSKETDKSSKTFKKLIRSIGRIAFYRAIRTALNQIAKGIEEGFGNLRQTDKALDKSLKQLSQSQTSFNNSLASLIAPLIKTIQPFITKMSDGLANISNRIAEAKAALKGQTTYTKILTSDTKEWNEQLKDAQGYLLSFDKFESLTTKKDEKDGYTGTIEAEVGMSTKEAQGIVGSLEAIKNSLIGIGGAIAIIASYKLISKVGELSEKVKTLEMNTSALNNIMNFTLFSGIVLVVSGIIDLVKNWNNLDGVGKAIRITIVALGGALILYSTLMKKSMKDTTGLTTAINQQKIAMVALTTAGVLALAGGILSLIDNWKDMGTTAKWLVPILSVLAGVIVSLVVGLKMAKGQWGKALAIGGIVTGAGLAVGSALSAQKYADGGMVPKGTTFIAGEAGAEIVHQSSAGTGVANIEQIRQAQYLATMDAIQDSGILNALSNIGGDVIIDGRKCGQVITKHVVDEGTRVGYFKKA